MPAVISDAGPAPQARTRPSGRASTQSGVSSSTSGVTASTVASSPRARAALAKAAKADGAHHVSTVDTSARPAGMRPFTSRKLSSDDAVVFTMKSTSSPGKRSRTQSRQPRPSSFTMITSERHAGGLEVPDGGLDERDAGDGTRGFGIANPAGAQSAALARRNDAA